MPPVAMTRYPTGEDEQGREQRDKHVGLHTSRANAVQGGAVTRGVVQHPERCRVTSHDHTSASLGR
jgi:hypothetical protein